MISLVADKVSAFQIRTVLVNLLAGNLVVVLTLTVHHLTTTVLLMSDVSTPPLQYCSVIVWLMGSGGGVRLLFTAVFAVVVFVMIKYSAKSTKKPVIIAASVFCWLCAFTVSAPLLVPKVVDSRFYGNVACYVYSSSRTNRKLLTGFLGFWVTTLGILPFTITLIVPIVALCYISRNQISGDIPYKKAMARFALFLLLGNSLNFLGQAVPPLVTYFTKQGPKEFYMKTVLSIVLMGLSLLPSPIIIIAYVKPVQANLRKMLCFWRVQTTISDKHSQAGKRMSSFTKSTSMGGIGSQAT